MTPEEFDLIEREFIRDTKKIEYDFNKIIHGNWLTKTPFHGDKNNG